MKPKQETPYFRDNVLLTMEDTYIEASDFTLSWVLQLDPAMSKQPQDAIVPQHDLHQHSESIIKLPSIELPNFSGDYRV